MKQQHARSWASGNMWLWLLWQQNNEIIFIFMRFRAERRSRKSLFIGWTEAPKMCSAFLGWNQSRDGSYVNPRWQLAVSLLTLPTNLPPVAPFINRAAGKDPAWGIFTTLQQRTDARARARTHTHTHTHTGLRSISSTPGSIEILYSDGHSLWQMRCYRHNK